MRVVITDSYQYSNFTVLKSFAELREILSSSDKAQKLGVSGSLDCLIINKCTEKDINAVSALATIVNAVPKCKLFYITDNPNEYIRMSIIGRSGKVIEDEYYLSDEDELESLIVTESETYDLVATDSNLDLIRDFILGYIQGDERIKLPYFITSVNNAVAALETQLAEKDQEVQNISATAIKTLEQIIALLTKTTVECKKLKQAQEEISMSQRNTRTQMRGTAGLDLFPSIEYKVPSMKYVLCIKEYTPCAFLTSFVLAYRDYLESQRHKRAKLIIVIPRGTVNLKRYESTEFTTITNVSASAPNSAALFEKPIVVINNPLKDNMDKLLTSGNYDTIIVLDRLMQGESSFVSGVGVKQLNAVDGETSLNKYKLDASKTIFSRKGMKNQFLCISAMREYPSAQGVDMRKTKYAQAYANTKLEGQNISAFEKLDNYLGIRGEYD